MVNPIFMIGPYAIVEWVFALVVITTCFLIYHRTKEFYELSNKHKGIKYFRYVFLYFGLAYMTRIILTIFRVLVPRYIFPISVAPFIFAFGVYASSLTFFYLMLTFFWKKLDGTILSNALLLHGVSIILATISIFQRRPLMFSIFQFGVFIALIIMMIMSRKHHHAKEKSLPLLFLLYSTVFGHWILIHLLELFSFFYPEVAAVIYAITLAFLVALVIKIHPHLGGKHEKKRKT